MGGSELISKKANTKMPPNMIWNQASFLYDALWTAEVDNKFIDLLREEVMLGNFRVGANNDQTLEVLRWIINVQFERDFSSLDVKRHVKKVQKRHRVFDWLVNMTGVLYDAYTNTIVGHPFVWDHICKECPFAYAYMTEGDPKWNELQIIFNDMNEPGLDLFLENVINISSSDSDDDLLMAVNGDYNFLPVIGGIPVEDINQINNVEVINAPYVQAIPVLEVSDDVVGSPDMEFWNEVIEGYVSDTGSEGYYNNDAHIMFPMAEIEGWPNMIDQALPSPTSPIQLLLGFNSPSSSASNSPTYGS
ncbi:hypothetical protein BUALT_Bualt11G0047100 [Buddleja alternifolia]|uniref:Myb/SANT-like domain-containing protein n=1 Tax=Buddleja alternifolia TaxID=168488 RepID=A0AAV6X3F2_9LAMI|nr:hypothetical protein BUALT_Bualt11G0047100 [Buddleja alternifolia]